jgi:hypothetical protein
VCDEFSALIDQWAGIHAADVGMPLRIERL